MNKYFEVKQDCDLYNDYFSYLDDQSKISAAFRAVYQKFGIQSRQFYMRKDCFKIIPTQQDKEKFLKMFKQNSIGEFKKSSEVSKMWVNLVKDVKHIRKPKLFHYFDMAGFKWEENLLHIGNRLYCCFKDMEDEGYKKKFDIPDFVIEMKASEFYGIMEENGLDVNI